MIDWLNFTPWSSLVGGLLIGLAAALFLLLNGRIAGISGIVGGLLRPAAGDMAWRVAFILGLVGAPLLFQVFSPLPAVRPPWPGKKIDLRKLSTSDPISPFAKLLRERHSVRDFDDEHPVTLAELARFLDTTARVLSEWKSDANFAGNPEITYSTRPYPAAGSAYELELYLAVSNCEGLARGLYHYDAGRHALVAIGVSAQQLQSLSAAAEFAMDAPGPPILSCSMWTI